MSIKVMLFQINVHRLLKHNLLCTLSGKRLTPINRSNYFRVYRKLITWSTNAKRPISARKAKHLDVTTCLHTLMQTRLSVNESARTILVILWNVVMVIMFVVTYFACSLSLPSPPRYGKWSHFGLPDKCFIRMGQQSCRTAGQVTLRTNRS